jgi:hypothetical protein
MTADMARSRWTTTMNARSSEYTKPRCPRGQTSIRFCSFAFQSSFTMSPIIRTNVRTNENGFEK